MTRSMNREEGTLILLEEIAEKRKAKEIESLERIDTLAGLVMPQANLIDLVPTAHAVQVGDAETRYQYPRAFALNFLGQLSAAKVIGVIIDTNT